MQKDRVFIDTSVLVRSLIADSKILKRLLDEYSDEKLLLYSNTAVLEETLYKVISLTTEEITGKTGIHATKKEWQANKKIIENVKDRFDILLELIDLGVIEIFPITMVIFKISYNISQDYSLLPNDALIAATCKHYEIKKIATFDKDFSRIDFLEVFKV